jgi:hypothetical protein
MRESTGQKKVLMTEDGDELLIVETSKRSPADVGVYVNIEWLDDQTSAGICEAQIKAVMKHMTEKWEEIKKDDEELAFWVWRKLRGVRISTYNAYAHRKRQTGNELYNWMTLIEQYENATTDHLITTENNGIVLFALDKEYQDKEKRKSHDISTELFVCNELIEKIMDDLKGYSKSKYQRMIEKICIMKGGCKK